MCVNMYPFRSDDNFCRRRADSCPISWGRDPPVLLMTCSAIIQMPSPNSAAYVQYTIPSLVLIGTSLEVLDLLQKLLGISLCSLEL